ncbi:MAG: aminotransferase class I/II-fold pyridoxal phosphate-dependent enzyme [Bacteroidales bacterium]|nr:aminotransferase class I/II-fold pyridoxal phosphate-dependent enzyme [Bacteroidales bacterium]
MMERIILSLAHMGGTEQKYVAEAFETNWIVPLGPLVNEFEHRLEKFLGTDHVVALSAGTAAVHLALVMLGVGKGDEVICQSFTFSASANPIRYCGAEPVFVDSESQTWNMDPEVLETAIKERKRITGKYPKAIIPVYLYGMPAKIDEIMAVAAKYGIPVVEDSAEALGSDYKGKKCGTFGEYGVLSFNGNKLITTSGGGALVCPSAEAAERVKFFATQARENRPYYYHEHIGYNYRLSNVSAGIGCGQMEVIEDHLARRREIHGLYVRSLSGIDGIEVHDNPSPDFNSNFWLTTITLDPEVISTTPDELRLALDANNIESRLLWRPMHIQPVYSDSPYYGGTVAEDLFARGLCLPSGSSLSDADIARVVETILSSVKRR